MPRRGENIYKRKDGRWEGRVKINSFDEKKSKYKSVYANTYKQCKIKLENIKLNKDEINIVGDNLTIDKLLNEWIKYTSIKVKATTLDNYKSIIDNHILPKMTGKLVNKISVNYLNNFVADKLKNGKLNGQGGLSPQSVKNIARVIKGAFKYGEEVYSIKNNARLMSLPKGRNSKIQVLTDDEIISIRNYCESHKDYFYIIYELCLGTGIRLGELCALQKNNIDTDNGILKIEKTVQRIKNRDMSESKTKTIIDSPKSKYSYREIPIPEKLLKKLNDYIYNKESNDYIFSNDGTKPIDVRTVQKKFHTVLKRCNIRNVKFHILRHTFATKWVNSKLDVKSLSEILGHSSVNITLALYVHPSIDDKRKQINLVYK